MMNIFLIAGLMAAASVPALAQVTPAPVAPVAPVVRVAPMADRVMTRAEVVAKVQEHFARMDTNRDGFIAGDELKARGEWKREMSAMRREGPDGAVGHGPIGDPVAAFDRLDANHDGMISRDEFAKGREMRIEKRVVMGGPGAPGAERGPMRFRMHRMGGMVGGRMIKMADTNKDGRVSLQEATNSALQHFDSADANRDGRLTPEEMRGAREQRVRMFKAG
jgi:Ca2+-binding EF-hand superfamily protein